MNSLIQSCQACEFRKQCSIPLAGIKFGSNPKIMVIADQPSFEDNYVETSFYDRQFQFLKSVLTNEFREWYLTYAVKCYNNSPLLIQKKIGKICTNEWLNKEISEIKPRLILTMGKLSFNLIVRPNIKKGENVSFVGNIGKIFCREADSINTVAWYTPQYLFSRGKKVEQQFKSTLENIKCLVG